MKITAFHFSLCVFHALCWPVAKEDVVIRMSPSRSQFRQYEHVSLTCEVSAGESRPRRNTESRGIESCPHGWGNLQGSTCTITTLYPADTGHYWCESSSGERSQTVHLKVTAALRVLPSRSQFFHYESVSLSCWQQGSSSEWRVKKNTSASTNKECSPSGSNRSVCHIDDLYPRDTGAYWCESAAGQCSDAVSITVIAGSVILESPAVPVMEGEDVTLRCTNSQTSSSSSSSVTAHFYKDELLIVSSSAGIMTLHNVSKSDDGLYKCNMSGEQSPESRLTVRVPDPGVPPELHEHQSIMSVPRLICHVVIGTPYLLSTIILGLICRDRRAHQTADRRHDFIMEVE